MLRSLSNPFRLPSFYLTLTQGNLSLKHIAQFDSVGVQWVGQSELIGVVRNNSVRFLSRDIVLGEQKRRGSSPTPQVKCNKIAVPFYMLLLDLPYLKLVAFVPSNLSSSFLLSSSS